MSESNGKVVKHVRVGGIEVTVWSNTYDGRETLSLTMQRNYKDAKGEWKKTGSLKQNDVPKAVLALQKAYESIVMGEKDQE